MDLISEVNEKQIAMTIFPRAQKLPDTLIDLKSKNIKNFNQKDEESASR